MSLWVIEDSLCDITNCRRNGRIFRWNEWLRLKCVQWMDRKKYENKFEGNDLSQVPILQGFPLWYSWLVLVFNHLEINTGWFYSYHISYFTLSYTLKLFSYILASMIFRWYHSKGREYDTFPGIVVLNPFIDFALKVVSHLEY